MDSGVLIGNTPCVKLPSTLTDGKGSVYVKLEEYNWGGSIKSRVGYEMIVEAERSGRINVDDPKSNVIIEGTGGNTGIGIAQVCALRGYGCILVVPDNYSKVRIAVLRALGATVIESDHRQGNDSHFKMVEEILRDNPNYIHLDQLNNMANVRAHYLGTGKELVRQTDEWGVGITHFIAGVGSGGTLTGVGRALKERQVNTKVFALQPAGCDVLRGVAVPHAIEGIAIGRVPTILDASIVDGCLDVTNDEVKAFRLDLAKKTGLFLGYSASANVLAAIQLAREENATVATVAPDGGRNYPMMGDN